MLFMGVLLPSTRIIKKRLTIHIAANTTTMMQQQRRRVQFDTSTRLIQIPAPLDLLSGDEHAKATLWYSREDLEQFRTEVRDLCTPFVAVTKQAFIERRKERSTKVQSQTKATCLTNSTMGPSLRGLEQRACVERQRRRLIGTRYIVKAQDKLKGDELALLAQRCTKWAIDLARAEAEHDYWEAYTTSSASLPDTKENHSPPKRKLVGGEQQSTKRIRPLVASVLSA